MIYVYRVAILRDEGGPAFSDNGVLG